MDGYVTKSEFAKIYGCSKPYVSELVAKRRLVLSEDGRLVNVDASLKLLNVTADPSKAGVRERWAAYRSGAQMPAAAPPPAPAAGPAEPPARQPDQSEYHQARTKREQAEAELATLELKKAMGQLLEADATLRAVVDAHLTARNDMLALPDRLTPLVAPETDARKVYELIQAECERTCDALGKKLAVLLAGPTAAT